MAGHRIPGLALAVVKNGVVVKQATLGLANVLSGLMVSTTTSFQVASTTKSFSSTAVLLLVSDGRLKLTDHVGDLLPGLPPAWRDVTVRQLLSHTSGLPDVTRTPGRNDLIADSWERALPLIRTAPRQFAPGERWSYNQTNYVLVAQIIERLSGMGLEQFLTTRLFVPLSMRTAFFPAPGDTARSCAVNYEPDPAKGIAVRSLEFPRFVHAAAGLCASLDDLIRWNAELDSGRLVRPDLTRELWSATPLNDGLPFRIDGKSSGYGLGWIVDDTPGHRSVGSSGGNSTAYRRFIDEGFSVIVLQNGVADPDGLIASVAAIVRERSGATASSAQAALWDAAMVGDTAAIGRSLADGAAIDSLDTRTKPTGRRALNWAAWFNHVEAVRLLLARGASIDAENTSGFTALHHAAEAGAEQAAEVLLAAGANPNHPNQAGERPAETARRLGHSKIASKLEGGRP